MEEEISESRSRVNRPLKFLDGKINDTIAWVKDLFKSFGEKIDSIQAVNKSFEDDIAKLKKEIRESVLQNQILSQRIQSLESKNDVINSIEEKINATRKSIYDVKNDIIDLHKDSMKMIEKMESQRLYCENMQGIVTHNAKSSSDLKDVFKKFMTTNSEYASANEMRLIEFYKEFIELGKSHESLAEIMSDRFESLKNIIEEGLDEGDCEFIAFKKNMGESFGVLEANFKEKVANQDVKQRVFNDKLEELQNALIKIRRDPKEMDDFCKQVGFNMIQIENIKRHVGL